MRYRTIIFDFDGTLADTENAMRESLNAVAKGFGFAPISEMEKEVLRRMNAREFLTGRLGIPVWNIFKTAFLVYKARKEFNSRSADIQLFPGISDLLRKFRAAGYQIGVVSTNSVSVIRGVLGDSNGDVDFIRKGSLLFGKSFALRRTLWWYGLSRHSVVYVGDEVRDARSCRTVGIPMIGVGWGLNDVHTLCKEGVDAAVSQEELRKKVMAE